MDDGLVGAGGGSGEVGVVRIDLVGVAVPAVVEPAQFDARDAWGLPATERADVHPREMADVAEVVDHSRRRDLPLLHPAVDAAEGRVVLVRDRRDLGHRLLEADPDEPVPVSYTHLRAHET